MYLAWRKEAVLWERHEHHLQGTCKDDKLAQLEAIQTRKPHTSLGVNNFKGAFQTHELYSFFVEHNFNNCFQTQLRKNITKKHKH